VWSSCVDPEELVMWLKSRFTCTFTHTSYFYSGSTHPHISTHFHLQNHPKNILFLIRERIAKNISIFPCEIMLKLSLLLTLAILFHEMSALKKEEKKRRCEEIKRGKCPEPRKKKRSETRGKNGQVSDS